MVASASATSKEEDVLFFSTRGGPQSDVQRKEALALQLLNVEAEIQAAFEPGRPMPRVRDVRRVLANLADVSLTSIRKLIIFIISRKSFCG